MGFQIHICEQLLEERRRKLQHEGEQMRLLAKVQTRRHGARWLVGKLGTAMVAIGTRLEHVNAVPATAGVK
jgi:hypothetical protein